MAHQVGGPCTVCTGRTSLAAPQAWPAMGSSSAWGVHVLAGNLSKSAGWCASVQGQARPATARDMPCTHPGATSLAWQ
jgi:hypothetical protein